MSDDALSAGPVVATPEPNARPGLFVAVVGPSGAGKDTLLRLAKDRLAGDRSIVFARRVVTRDAAAGAEDHDVMSPEAFDAAERAGAFCLSWRAHRLAYGLPAGLEYALARGDTVVANVSRQALDAAARRFARLAVVEITASKENLVARIAARGRESPAEIEARVARQITLIVPQDAEAFHRIVNDATPQAAAESLVALLSPRATIAV